MTKVLYYLPVDEKYIDQWEYYKVDKEMLNNYYDQVIICSNFFSFFKNIFIVDHVYAWWWHRSEFQGYYKKKYLLLEQFILMISNKKIFM